MLEDLQFGFHISRSLVLLSSFSKVSYKWTNGREIRNWVRRRIRLLRERDSRLDTNTWHLGVFGKKTKQTKIKRVFRAGDLRVEKILKLPFREKMPGIAFIANSVYIPYFLLVDAHYHYHFHRPSWLKCFRLRTAEFAYLNHAPLGFAW